MKYRFEWFRKETKGAPHWLIFFTVIAYLGVGTAFAVSPPPGLQPTPESTLTSAEVDQDPSSGEATASPTESAQPADEQADLPTALFVGDSAVAGVGSGEDSARWTALVAEHFEWSEANEALSGTGYATTAGQDQCGRETCGTFAEVIADVAEVNPAVIVISGGRYDSDDQWAFRSGVSNALAQSTQRWPEAAILVTNTVGGADTLPPVTADKNTIISELARQVGAEVINIGQPLQGQPSLVTDEGDYPNNDGHRAIADAFIQAVEDSDVPLPNS